MDNHIAQQLADIWTEDYRHDGVSLESLAAMAAQRTRHTAQGERFTFKDGSSLTIDGEVYTIAASPVSLVINTP